MAKVSFFNILFCNYNILTRELRKMTKLAVGPSMRALPTRPLQCSPTLHSLKFLLLANAGAVLTKFSRNLISTWKEVSRNLSAKISLMMRLKCRCSAHGLRGKFSSSFPLKCLIQLRHKNNHSFGGGCINNGPVQLFPCWSTRKSFPLTQVIVSRDQKV